VPRTRGPAGGSGRPSRSARSEERDAAVRATLQPLGPGERPWALRVAVALAVVLPLINLVMLGAGYHPLGGHGASAGSDLVYVVVMLACAGGMWQKRYGAVLAFQVVLLITILAAALALVRASNLLGFVEATVVLALAGWLFYKLIRVLSRLQLPRAGVGRR
jgi:prepilin signal peptidase PulO-like enzyme (type II secretory pathway)